MPKTTKKKKKQPNFPMWALECLSCPGVFVSQNDRTYTEIANPHTMCSIPQKNISFHGRHIVLIERTCNK